MMTFSFIRTFRVWIFDLIGQSSFVQNVMKISFGASLAQLINFLIAPFLTRIYGPDSLGVFAMLMGISGVLLSFSTLRYDMAIVLPKSERDARLLLFICLALALLFLSLSLIALYFGGHILSQLIHLRADPTILYFVAPYVFASSLVVTFSYFTIRRRLFSSLAYASVLGAAAAAVVNVLLGLKFGRLQDLFWAAIFGQFVQFTVLLFGAWQGGISPAIDQAKIRRLLKSFIDFPLYQFPQNLMNTISAGFPAVFLASYASPAAAAFFWLSNRVLLVPASLVSNSVRNVLYERVSSHLREGLPVRPLILRTTTVLAVIGLLPLLFIIFCGPQIFGFVFGQSWEIAGRYARWVAILAYFGFANVPAVVALTACKGQKVLLLWEVASTCSKVGVLVVLALAKFSPLVLVAAYSSLGALAYAILILLGLSWTNRSQLSEAK